MIYHIGSDCWLYLSCDSVLIFPTLLQFQISFKFKQPKHKSTVTRHFHRFVSGCNIFQCLDYHKIILRQYPACVSLISSFCIYQSLIFLLIFWKVFLSFSLVLSLSNFLQLHTLCENKVFHLLYQLLNTTEEKLLYIHSSWANTKNSPKPKKHIRENKERLFFKPNSVNLYNNKHVLNIN